MKVEKLKFQSTSFFQLQRGGGGGGGVRGKSYFQKGGLFSASKYMEMLKVEKLWKIRPQTLGFLGN